MHCSSKEEIPKITGVSVLNFESYTLLKIFSKLSSHSTDSKYNGYLTILLGLSVHIMVIIKLNYGYGTVFGKNDWMTGQFAISV